MRYSKNYFVFILFLFSLFAFSQEVNKNQQIQKDRELELPLVDWQEYITPDDDEYLKHMYAMAENPDQTIRSPHTYSFPVKQSNPNSVASNTDEFVAQFQKKIKDGIKEREEKAKADFPEWLRRSSLKSMPPLLKGIFNYLRTKQKNQLISSCHRFILTGKPGTGKTTLAHAIAYELGYEVIFIHASSLFGRYRNNTAINLSNVFKHAKCGGDFRQAIIIDELHKLFEGHKNKHTDDAANATAFWNQIDEIEKQYPNIIIIGTANTVEKLPPEIKSRFHGKIIKMPLPTAAQRRNALHEIMNHDSSIQIGSSIDKTFLMQMSDRLDAFSLRDIQSIFNTAKMFKYAESNEDCDGPIVLQRKHFERALAHLESEKKERFSEKVSRFLKKIGKETRPIAEIAFIISLGAGGTRSIYECFFKKGNGS